jgi:osmoprotectant transport system ATP-binding protein
MRGRTATGGRRPPATDDAAAPALELRGVAKRFGNDVAIDDVDLAVAAGSVTALIGPSGCGKSTILRLFNGLVRPDVGSVRVDGAELDDAALERVRRRMGYVIQDGGLFPHMTARANVTVMARHIGWNAARTADRVDELVDLVGLGVGLLDRYPRELSGGQAQRVALMRALMLRPSVLLLDEPMAALDPMIRSALQEDLAEIFAALETTVVLVSHDLAEATFLSHRVVLLRAGRIVQEGSPAELVSAPVDDFARRFVRAQRGLQLAGMS